MHAQQIQRGRDVAGGFSFLESPRYHDGKLYVSDMTACAIYEIDPNTGEKTRIVHAENQPNGIAFAPDGSLMWTSMFDGKVYRHDLKTGKNSLHADLQGVLTGYCGDMVVDRKGRVYLDDVGARVLHGEAQAPGRVILIEVDGTFRVVEENLMFPNAIFIDNEGTTLYCAESLGWGLFKWDIAPDGSLSNRQKVWSVASIAPGGKTGLLPGAIVAIDGGCMDSQGGTWLSLISLGKYVRIDSSGTVTHEIEAGGHATACTLGGPDGKTLYLATAHVPDGQDQFSAMAAKTTWAEIGTARVPVGKGTALP